MSPIAVAGLVVLLGGLASCSSSALPPHPTSVGEVTGFVSVPLMSGVPSGPVTVAMTGIEASRLARLVSALPTVGHGPLNCHEPLGLMYRIVFAAGLVAQPKAVVDGYRCGAQVMITAAGTASSWRRDSACRLIRAVRQVLPGRAKATQTLAIGCNS
jgi:hypothetical protein